MNDYVLSRVFDPLLYIAEEHDVDEAMLVEGLSFTHEEVRKAHYLRVPWNEYALYCQRLEDTVGTQPFDEVGKYLPEIVSFLPFARVAGLLASPRWFYDVSKIWFGPTMFPALELEEFEEIGPRTLRVVIRIPEVLADCPQFFRITASFDREGPVYLGMLPATVRLDLEPRRGVYLIHYPPSLSLPARAKRAVKAVFASDSLLEEYALQHENLLTSYDAAHRSELSFQYLVEKSPDALMVFEEHQILYVNDAMREFLGVDVEEPLVGQPVSAICAEPEALMIASERPRNEEGVSVQAKFLGPNDNEIQGEVKTIAVHFEGKPAFVSIVRDVTLRNEVLARAMEMDRIIAMGMLAAGVGHEISNPLAAVYTNLEFLRDLFEEGQFDESDREEVVAALRDTISGVERIQHIAGDLQTFARVPQENLEPVDINAALQPSLHWIEHELRDRARLEVSLQASTLVWSNANRVGQVALNLLVNGAQAIESGSPETQTVRVSTYDERDRVILEVEDTGKGIAEEFLEKIFDPFFTTKPEGQGTGLGLFLTRKIVDHLQGTITVESTLGQGTCVRVALPAYPRS